MTYKLQIGPTFKNWAREEPKQGRNCGYLQNSDPNEHRGQWRSKNCSEKLDFVCGRPAGITN